MNYLAEIIRTDRILDDDTEAMEGLLVNAILKSHLPFAAKEAGREPQDNPSDHISVLGSDVKTSRQRPDEEAGPETQYYFQRFRRIDRLERKLGLNDRMIAAVLGGLSLIAPMLIMAINPSKVKTLVTSSMAVLLFSVGLAWKSTAKTEALLGTAAAYAAVMVVFVGISST